MSEDDIDSLPARARGWERFKDWLKKDARPTDWAIVILTGGLVLTSFLQWKVIRDGSADTHSLAEAAKQQATDTHDLAVAGAKQAIDTHTLAEQAGHEADAAKAQADAAVNQVRELQQEVNQASKLSAAATGANEISSRALDAQTRPWLGIDGDLTPISSGRAADGSRNPAIFSLKLRNYGQSPAMKIDYRFRFSNAASKNQALENDACDEATSVSTATNVYVSTSRLTIFPGDAGVTPITQDVDADVFPQFLVGCIAYQGESGGRVRTTRFSYSIRQDKIKGQIFQYILSGAITD